MMLTLRPKATFWWQKGASVDVRRWSRSSSATLHWIASVPDGDLVEYCLCPSPLMRKLAKNLPPLVDGRVPAPDGPRLGIELDEDVVAEFRVAD